jgi:hypothetical protein
MEVVAICGNLKNVILSGSSFHGRVHSVFKNACNLVIYDDIVIDIDTNTDSDEVDDTRKSTRIFNRAGGRFITLLNSNKVMSPMSMLVDSGGNFDFRALDLKQNMKFEISDVGVLFKELDIEIPINRAKPWNPECELTADQLDKIRLEKNINRLETGLFSKGKFSGLETLIQNLCCEIPVLGLSIPVKVSTEQQKDNGLYGYNNYGFISDKFRTFIKVLIQGDREGISESCKKIIGFGNGLTPSIDDFINGLMITNVYMGKGNGIAIKDLFAFNLNMVEASLSKTTKISSEMLKNGIYGLANDAVKQLMMLLLAGKESKQQDCNTNEELKVDRNIIESSKESDEDILAKEIDKAIEVAVDYGETSGTDTALGLYIGLKIWTNYDYRRVMLNDFICRN